jgi:PAS domain S-box-containing protein
MINQSGGVSRVGRVGRTAQQVEQRSRPLHQSNRVERDQADVGQRARERLFRTTFDRAVIGIAHTSPEGRWLRVNQRLCDLLGYTRDELATRTVQDLTHPDDLDASAARVCRLLAGELDADEWDKRCVRKDGTVLWTHLSVSLVRTADGRPDHFITMVQDITERQRLEQERARLLEWERAARHEAEAANGQLQALQALTDTALSHLALDDLLRELLCRVTSVLGVEQVGILLLDADGRTLTLQAACGLLEAAPGYDQFAMGQGFPGRVAASRASLIVDTPSADDLDGSPPLLRERLHSAAGVPLLVEDPTENQASAHPMNRLVGVLVVGSATPRHFTEADVQLLQRAADRIALAIDRARLYTAEQDARHQAEAALARAQGSEAQASERAERLHTILETMADGVAVYDAEGRPLQVVNHAYRELYALERGPAGYESLPSFERARLLQVRDAATGALLLFDETPAGRALRGEVVTGSSADIRARAFDGRELEVNTSAAPLRDGDGRVSGAVLVLRDLTERNRLVREREAARADELTAREASRRMEAFLAVAAHDLRAPLTAVVGYLDLAAHQTKRLAAVIEQANPALTPRVDAVLQQLGDVGQGAQRLTRLLTLLFDTAAIRAGKLELHRAPADLATLLRTQVDAFRVAAPERTLRLHLPGDGVPIPVEVDADRIGQVVTNYVTNALKYSAPDRPVDISVSVAARRGRARGARVARVTVCDQGPGIPMEEQAHVWELFHRVSGTKAQDVAQGGSLGLGLYICQAIVEAHGGRVGVRSAVGKGSTFWFTLPLATGTG